MPGRDGQRMPRVCASLRSRGAGCYLGPASTPTRQADPGGPLGTRAGGSAAVLSPAAECPARGHALLGVLRGRRTRPGFASHWPAATRRGPAPAGKDGQKESSRCPGSGAAMGVGRGCGPAAGGSHVLPGSKALCDRASLPAGALDAVVVCVPRLASKGRVTPDFRAKLSWGGRYRCPAYRRSPASAGVCVQEKVGGSDAWSDSLCRGGRRCSRGVVRTRGRAAASASAPASGWSVTPTPSPRAANGSLNAV